MANNSVVVKIDGDDSGFEKSMSGIGKVAKKSLGITVKGIAATSAGLAGLTAAAVKGYAEFQQLTGGVETLFKTSADKVKKYAQEAYKTAGLSANEYMSTVTSFSASLLQSLGGDTQKAADYAHQAIIDMSDNANKMGTDMSMIQNAYQGFAKQNYTMLDNLKLGYGGTKEEMVRLINEAAKLDKSVKANDMSFGNIVKAIHAVQNEMDITGTTAKEAATTISGSVGMMKASWSNLVTGMADKNADIDKLTDEFIDSLMTVGDNLIPVIKTALNGAGKFIKKASKDLVPEVVDVIVSTLPELVSAGAEAIKALVEGMSQNSEEIAKASVDIMLTIIETLKELIPLVVTVAAEIITKFATELGKAVPVLKPLTDIIALLASNLDALLPAIIGVTAAIAAFRIATFDFTGKVSGLTGAIKVLYTTMKAHPIGAVIAGTTALIGVGSSLVKMLEKEHSVTAKTIEQAKKRRKEIAENVKAYEELKKTQIEQAAADLEQVSRTQVLYDELKTLADANGVVEEKYRSRANFILGELNSAYGTEFKMIDGIITGYQDMQKEIDNLISKKKWEISQKAALPVYEEAYNNQIKKRIEWQKDLNEVEKQKLKVQEAALAVEEARAKKEEIFNKTKNERTAATQSGLGSANNRYSQEIKALKELEKTCNESYNSMKAEERDLRAYQKAEMKAAEGNYEEAAADLAIFTSDFHKKMNDVEGDIEKQRKVAETEFSAALGAVQTYLDNVANGSEEFDEETLRRLIAYAETVGKEAEAIGANVGEGMIVGLDGQKVSLLADAKALADSLVKTIKDRLQIKSPSRVSRDEIGKMFTKGIAVGIKQGEYEVSDATKALFDDLELQRDLNVISEAEYYKQLEYLRDEHIKAGTKEWWDYTKELIDYSNDLKEEFTDNVEDLKDRAAEAYEDLADDAIDKMDAVLDKQEDFKNQLRDMSDLYSEGTEKDRFGTDKPVFSLTDWEKENKTIEAYNKTLTETGDRLKTAFGDDSEGYEELMQIIRDGGMEDGLQLMTLLRQANDEEFLKYVKGFQENRRLTDEISSDYFKEERSEIASEYAKGFNEVRAKFEEEFDSLPEEFFAPLGEDCSSEFGEAFMIDLEAMLKDAKTQIGISMSKAWSEAFGPDSRNAITYSSTYYVQPANGESTNAQLRSIREAETLNRMRG